jgi:hypothetical protein
VPRHIADTITPTTDTSQNDNLSISSSPTTESLLTLSSDRQSSEDISENENPLRVPPPPVNTLTPPSPKIEPVRHRNMQFKNIPEFAGMQEDTMQPLDFLKSVKRSFLTHGAATDEQKIDLFSLYLKTDSPAEDWFNDAKTLKKMWLELDQEFKARFPNIKKATKMAPELERELRAMRLTMKELEKTEKYRGEEMHIHMIFAEKILDLAKRAKVEKTMSGLWSVRDELLEVLRERIPEVQADWIAFMQAIKGVDMGHIREGVRKYKEKAAHNAKVNADINFLKQCTANATVGSLNSPTRAIRTQLASITISQQTTSYPAQRDPFGGIEGSRGNLFNAHPPRSPAIEAEKMTIRATLALYPMQPETPEGEAAYLDQLQAWRQLNGNNHVSKTTGFSLHPGGAPPGSGECYNCGRAGH